MSWRGILILIVTVYNIIDSHIMMLLCCFHIFPYVEWTILEEVFLQVTRFSLTDWGQFALTTLKKEFPNSKRVKLYEAIFHQCEKNYDKAINGLTLLLHENPDDIVCIFVIVTELHEDVGGSKIFDHVLCFVWACGGCIKFTCAVLACLKPELLNVSSMF